jgi:hypothetical protein
VNDRAHTLEIEGTDVRVKEKVLSDLARGIGVTLRRYTSDTLVPREGELGADFTSLGVNGFLRTQAGTRKIRHYSSSTTSCHLAERDIGCSSSRACLQ